MARKPLEKPSDFERALKLLDDHSSSPEQYIFNPDFGFCALCGDVTEYEFIADPEEVYLECTRCEHQFMPNAAMGTSSFFLSQDPSFSRIVIYIKDVEDIINSDNVPKNNKTKLQRLLSREGQREMLLDALKKRVEVENSKVLQLSALLQEARENLFEYDELLAKVGL